MIGILRGRCFQSLVKIGGRLIAGSLALLSISVNSRGADWPMLFRDNARNAVSSETNLPAAFVPGTSHLVDTNVPPPKVTNLKWRTRLGTHAYGGPVVSGGRIFVGTTNDKKGGLLMALEESTGAAVWQLSIPKFVTTKHEYNYDDLDLGICSTPTVVDGQLYFVSNRDEAFCMDTRGRNVEAQERLLKESWAVEGSAQNSLQFDAKDAGIDWVVRMLIENHVEAWVQDASSCSVIVDGDYVYVCPSNGVDRSHKKVPHPHAPSIIVLNRRTGKLVARDFEDVGTRLFHGEWSSPAMGVVNGKKLLFFGAGDGVCYAFDAEPVPAAAGEDVGKLKLVWKFDIDAAGDRRGKYRTVAGPSEVIATPVFFSNRVYLGVGQDPRHGEGRGVLACIDATKNGDVTTNGQVWVNTTIDRSLTTVAIDGGLLFTADFTGRIFCMDPDTGKIFWMHETHRPIWSSPLIADGKVFVGTDTGDLWTFAESKDLNVLGKTKLDSAISASPVAANGVLYVMTQHWLYAVASGANVTE